MQKGDVLKFLKQIGMETKANEVMHTGNTGAGAEFIPAEEFTKEIFNILPTRNGLLPLLPGNHGIGLPKKYTAAAVGLSVGDTEFEKKGQWTTGTGSQTEDDHTQQRAVTKQVSINQNPFIAEVDISDEQLKYNAVNTEQYVKDRLAQGMLYTVDSLILNGDTEPGATGNINLVDSTPGSKKFYLTQDGARKLAIAGSYSSDLGTLASGDYVTLMSLLGEYATSPDDVLFVQNIGVTMKALQLAEFITKDKAGDKATAESGVLRTVWGAGLLTHRAIKKANAVGKVSVTPGNNTTGSIAALFKPAIQYGFGQDFKVEVVRIPGYGWRLVATFDFGFTIIDSGTGLTDSAIALGYNVTI